MDHFRKVGELLARVAKMDDNLRFMKTGTKVGILGGGQLAKMLAESATRLGVRVVVFAASSTEPAARAVAETEIGAVTDGTALARFCERVDIVVFENEFVDGKLLANQACRFVPEVSCLEKLRDKLTQKEMLKQAGLPVTRFLAYDGKTPAKAWIASTLKAFDGKCVLKWGRLGYDGKGVLVCSQETADRGVAFLEAAIKAKVSFFAEELVPFVRELAILGCRSITGEFTAYPLVITEQKDAVCARVQGPATALGVSAALETAAVSYAKKLAETSELRGMFAIELFETKKGELLINEVAPRVHNSGHFTQDASATSQFENHLRAALGLPLGETTSRTAFAMENLLGPSGVSVTAEGIPLPVPTEKIHMHWYDKSEIRPGRKLGHLNGGVSKVEDLSSLLTALTSCREAWEEVIRGGKE